MTSDCDITRLPGFPPAGTNTFGGSFFFQTILHNGRDPLAVHVKCFGRQGRVKDLLDWRAGSSARRSWQVALAMREKGLRTPRPIAFLDRWDGRRLIESYLFTELQQDAQTFKDELIRLYTIDPECAKIMALLECVARAIKQMHDEGIFHRDLGNQNILVSHEIQSNCSTVQFVDLNRARVVPCVSIAERAFDISRISLPSDFLRVFKEMYFDDVVPSEFQEWEKTYRRRFERHTRTRMFRHPLRTLGHRAFVKQQEYPPDKDIWVWDERSAQAISPFTSRDRRRHLSMKSHLGVAVATAGAVVRIIRSYRAIMARAFRDPVRLDGCIGMTLNPVPETLERELGLLGQLGKIPVLLRFHRHSGEGDWEFRAGVLRRLSAEGHSVSAALIQDRAGVNDSGKWTSFVEYVLSRVADCVDMVEVGHAINRSKWGIWTLDEHRRLMDATASAGAKYPSVKFMGPAGIDFEYPFVIAALRHMPAEFNFSAISHHLYVDRRGAPESRQGPFSTLEKCALGRAIADKTAGCGGRFIVSEVNWPVSGTGVFSPVGSPYVSPGPRYGDPSVSEDTYSDYMIRYLLIACCSGVVERVYWWRLVARGFGLVDDTQPEQWRERSAYRALHFFLATLGKGTFIEKMNAPAGVGMYLFTVPSGAKIAVAYSIAGVTRMRMPFSFSRVVNSSGQVGGG
ncbi:MAG: lipopolysaccharide kinase InaA family protein, partial [bacterium]